MGSGCVIRVDCDGEADGDPEGELDGDGDAGTETDGDAEALPDGLSVISGVGVGSGVKKPPDPAKSA